MKNFFQTFKRNFSLLHFFLIDVSPFFLSAFIAGAITSSIFGGVVIGFAVVLIIEVLMTHSAQKGEAIRLSQRKEDFWKDCKKFGIVDYSAMNSPEKQQRLKLLATKYHFDHLSADELLQIILEKSSEEEKKAQEEEQKDIELCKAKEQATFEKLTQYACLHGAEKPITMLNDIADSLKKSVQGERIIATKKESDGAIMAGVASGIGGVVPAMMSFSNTERVNQEIRQHNEAAKAINAMTAQIVGETHTRAREYQKAAEQVSLKLIAELPPKKLFRLLTFQNTTITVSKTGSIVISTEVTADDKLTIFDHVPAFIDGSVKAEIFDGEQKIGETTMVFPAFGTIFYYLKEKRYDDGFLSISGIKKDSQKPVKLEGICLFCGQHGHKYTVKFAPGDLWAMER